MSIILKLIKSPGQAFSNAPRQDFSDRPESHLTDIVAAVLAVPAYYTLRTSMPPIVKLSILAPMAFVVGAAGLIEHMSSR